jgi:tripartite-type tricarboxylate transporter receptor subunit TctC
MTAGVRETLERIGGAPSPLSPAEFKSYIAVELQKWKDAIASAGITPE